MPSRKDRRAIPDWISNPKDYSGGELELLNYTEEQLDREYSIQDLRRQRKLLLVFLGKPWANFGELCIEHGSSLTDRQTWFSPIEEWVQSNKPYFPPYVRVQIGMLYAGAGCFAYDPSTIGRHPETKELMQQIWRLLVDYERLLRLKIRRAESKARSTSKKTVPQFPTPPGAHWGHVKIRVLDDERASVKVNEKVRIYTYVEMAMADGRNGKPDRQWLLLTIFARNHGELTWDKSDARRENKKVKEDLDKALRAFFGINQPAFRLTDDRKGWRARFEVSRE